MSSRLTLPSRAYPVTKTCIRRQSPIQSPGLTKKTAAFTSHAASALLVPLLVHTTPKTILKNYQNDRHWLP